MTNRTGSIAQLSRSILRGLSMIAPTYGLHLDSDYNILSAKDFTHSYECNEWMSSLDIRPGDRIEFKALHVRADFEEVPEAPPVAPPPSPAPAMIDMMDRQQVKDAQL